MVEIPLKDAKMQLRQQFGDDTLRGWVAVFQNVLYSLKSVYFMMLC
jgi:hypothetical protein